MCSALRSNTDKDLRKKGVTMFDLTNRVAVVTGGSGYLGRSHSVHLARAGARIVVADVREGAETVAAVEEAGGKAIWMETDVTSWDSVQEMARQTVEEFGRIDVLVNNAALVSDIQKPWTDISPEEWRRNIDVDLNGMFLCARAVHPAMAEQGVGRIVNISSGTMAMGMPMFLHYVSAKAGVIGFTRSLATEVGPEGITVNALLVGFFPHDFGGGIQGIEEMTEMVVGMQAIKRVGQPEDLSPIVVFLASEEARWITGQAIAVDGGLVRSGG
jgi:3-oxoacyl-[acyl-carrier protein] reductase